MTSRGDQWMKIHKFGCVSQCYYLIGDVWRTLWTPIRELSPALKKRDLFCKNRKYLQLDSKFFYGGVAIRHGMWRPRRGL